jgi:hypothetical protein
VVASAYGGLVTAMLQVQQLADTRFSVSVMFLSKTPASCANFGHRSVFGLFILPRASSPYGGNYAQNRQQNSQQSRAKDLGVHREFFTVKRH